MLQLRTCSIRYYVMFFDVFFFKQKTAYEMRISDWSSDVCSSDLSTRAANRLQGVAPATALQFAKHRCHDARARGTKGMPQGDRAAIDVQLVPRNTQFLHPGDRHAGTSLIHLEQIDIIDRQSGTGQPLARRSDRAGQHQFRVRTDGDETAAKPDERR